MKFGFYLVTLTAYCLFFEWCLNGLTWISFIILCFASLLTIRVVFGGEEIMETWELWEDLPTKIIHDYHTYRLTIEKFNGFVKVSYINTFDVRGEYYLHSLDAGTLHEALDKMWLWWQEYEVKE